MKEDILKLSEKLIKIKSVDTEMLEMSKVLDVTKNALSGINFKSYKKNNIESLLYFNKKTLPRKFEVILNAHIDVVSGNSNQFQPKIKGDLLIGRGASDMKAAAAVEILVFKELQNKVNYPLGLQIVTDEETGGFYGTEYQIKKGIKTNFAISGESTNLDINNQSKGVITIRITIKGNSAHSAYLWEGENAIIKGLELVAKINKLYPVPTNEVWKTTVNIARIETSNLAYNKVPSDCTISLNIRYIEGDKENVLKNIKSLLLPGFTMEITEEEPTHYTSRDNAYINALEKSVKKITSKNPKIISKHGASDVRHFNKINENGVCFGPIGEGLHTDNEWVSIKSLENYYKILKDFLLSLNKHE